MSDEKIAGAPAAIAPEPAAEVPTATLSASATPVPQPVAAMPARQQNEPIQLSLAEAVTAAAPEPAPPAPAAAAGGDLDALRAELAAELERTKSAREAVEAISTRTADRNRIAYLRKMGASDTLSDEHLMTLAPHVDPDTSEGAAALQSWRDQNAALFKVQQGGAMVSAKMVEQFKSSAHGTFGADFHRAQMRATFGGE